MTSSNVKLTIIAILSISAVVILYRIATDETVTMTLVTGVVFIGALLLLTAVSDRLKEFSASSKGISASLSKLDKEIIEIQDLLLSGIDKDTSAVLAKLKESQLESPISESDRNELKFRLRVLREKAFLIRDETKCKSISNAVKKEGNISHCFIITELGLAHLRKLTIDNA